MEVLKTLVAVFSKLSKHVQDAAPAVLGQCCNLFSRCLPLYRNSKILAASDDDDDAQVSWQPIYLHLYPLPHLEVVLPSEQRRHNDTLDSRVWNTFSPLCTTPGRSSPSIEAG
jgi:hypothetical protein